MAGAVSDTLGGGLLDSCVAELVLNRRLDPRSLLEPGEGPLKTIRPFNDLFGSLRLNPTLTLGCGSFASCLASSVGFATGRVNDV
jgi:hypothetical protein